MPFDLFQWTCPACGAHAPQIVVLPEIGRGDWALLGEYREGTHARPGCPRCAREIAVDAPLLLIVAPHKVVLAMLPGDWEDEWDVHEARVRAALDAGLSTLWPRGKPAPDPADLMVRLVFGVAAFREKLWCVEGELDDATLEALKLELGRRDNTLNPLNGPALRLIDVKPEALLFERMPSEPPEPPRPRQHIRVTRALYDEVAAEPAWGRITRRFLGALYGDLGRVLTEPPPEVH